MMLKVTSPYDFHLIKEIAMHDEKQAEQMLASAYALFRNQKKWLPVHERIAILERTIKLIDERKSDLARQAAEEGGKPLIDSEVEIARAMQGIKTAIAQLYTMAGTQIPMSLSPSTVQRLAYTLREPIGVVFAISAFNHPFNLIVHQVIPAVAVGCPVIVKPATSTPISAMNLVNILYEAGLPKTWCQLLICKSTVAEKLVSDERVQFLSFIGSARVGWYLRSKLAPGAHCTLEHGGAAPVIIDDSADYEDAIPLLVKGGFYHAGQVCVSVQRIFVADKKAKEVAEQIAKHAKKLIVGDPVDSKTEVGPLIQPSEVDRVEQWISEAKQQGAKVITGGKKISNSCYEPTVLLNPSLDSVVSTSEIFGPVVNVYSYKNLDQAIQQANAVPFVFQAAVFSKNIDVAFDAVKRLKANTVMINDHTAFRADWMPFSGSEHSGLGVGGIPYTMRDMTHEKLWVLRSKYV